MAKLYNIKGKKAFPTEAASNIWYIKEIQDKYGEANTGDLLYYSDCLYSLDPEENPFADLDEDVKHETIIRACFPELELFIDFEDPVIIQFLDLVKDLYETSSYRVHKGFKNVLDKLAISLQYAYVDLTKADGNSGELKKAAEVYDEIKNRYKVSYREMMEELEVEHNRGGRKSSAYQGVSKKLK